MKGESTPTSAGGAAIAHSPGADRAVHPDRTARRVFRARRTLDNGRTKRGIEGVGNLIFPKSYAYYRERAG